jgi:hypothetical protein
MSDGFKSLNGFQCFVCVEVRLELDIGEVQWINEQAASAVTARRVGFLFVCCIQRIFFLELRIENDQQRCLDRDGVAPQTVILQLL